jgi:hypothetical protein
LLPLRTQQVSLSSCLILVENFKKLSFSALNSNPRDQRIGRVMLNYGSNIKKAHLIYWDNHPKAVSILEKHKEELEAFMESKAFFPKKLLFDFTV